jgi:hypothetical protein
MVLSLALVNGPSFGATPRPVDIDQLSVVHLPSPDGHCTVSTAPTEESRDEDAKLFVRCGVSRRKLLSHYFRSGEVIWSPDSRTVIFLDEHSVEEYTLKLFRIDDAGASDPTVVDRAIVKSVESQLRGKEVVFYYVNFVRFAGVSHMVVDADVIFIRRGATGPTQEAGFRFDVDLSTFTVDPLRNSPVH